MTTILAFIGAVHCAGYLAGIFIPGLTYHFMFGGQKEVKEWHRLHAGDDE